jgi:hypothetical protein
MTKPQTIRTKAAQTIRAIPNTFTTEFQMEFGVTIIAANKRVRARLMSVMHMLVDNSHIGNGWSIGISLTSKKITLSAEIKQIVLHTKNAT